MHVKTIKRTIMLWMGGCLVVSLLAGVVFSAYLLASQAEQARRAAVTAAEDQIIAAAQDVADAYRDVMISALNPAQTLAQVLAIGGDRTPGKGSDAPGLTREDVTMMLKRAIEANPEFLGIYTDWEPQGFDGRDAEFAGQLPSDSTGRFMPWWMRTPEGIQLQTDLDTYADEAQEDYYRLPMETKQAMLVDPYVDMIDDEQVLMTSLVAPILAEDEQFLGIAGVDISLSHLQALVEEYAASQFSGNAAIEVISHGWIVVADSEHPDWAGQSIQEVRADWQEFLSQGDEDTWIARDDNGTVLAFARFQLKSTAAPWTVVLSVPEAKFTEQADAVLAQSYRALAVMVGLGLAFTLVALMVVWRIAGTIAGPIQRTAGFLNEVAEGDISQDVPTALGEREDETGILARATQAMAEGLRKMFKDLNRSVNTITSTSGRLSSISAQTARGSTQISTKVNLTANAAENMSAQTAAIAQVVEQATASLVSVASATEELTATMGEIAVSAENARETTFHAASQADRISAMMQELGNAAQDIGKVTETIAGISAQTNLLALNATIEAARAGAAGRGFSVVANEIKGLARQTAEATGEIKARIANVQASTSGAIDEIEQIVGVIKEVNETVSSISSAIEEQSAVVRDIAGNIAMASAGTENANRHMAQAATISRDIATEIAALDSAAQELASAGELAQFSAAELSGLAEQIQALLQRYRV